MLLYLVRHAKAGDPDPDQWPDDAERPLTEKGHAQFARAARALRRRTPPAEVVLSSPLMRAWQTASLLNTQAHWEVPQVFTPLGRGATPWQVLAELDAATSLGALALVGHEPMMSQLLSLLVTGDPDRLRVDFDKGMIACLEVTGRPRAGQARLLWLAPPTLLRSKSKN